MTPSGSGAADPRPWISLSLIEDVGPIRSRALLASFGSPEAIFKASEKELCETNGISVATARRIRSFSNSSRVESILRDAQRSSVRVVTLGDTDYPEQLRNLDDAPVVLYVRGSLQRDDRFGIAVVGSRKFTPYGESVCCRIASEMSEWGLTVVSGMALGIDSVAHQAALSAGGRTLAVVGSGPDICYPSENRRLMERIICSGAVVSEFPPGTEPLREHFPRRNRLISGLSLGVLVVEAAAKSGALITARAALEQNREVFAVPGNITAAQSEGTNRLIREGAKVVLEAKDILEELAPVLKGFLRTPSGEGPVLSDSEKSLCAHLSGEPVHVDTIAREARMPVQEVLNRLLALELKGAVRQAGGARYYLVWGGRSDQKNT